MPCSSGSFPDPTQLFLPCFLSISLFLSLLILSSFLHRSFFFASFLFLLLFNAFCLLFLFSLGVLPPITFRGGGILRRDGLDTRAAIRFTDALYPIRERESVIGI